MINQYLIKKDDDKKEHFASSKTSSVLTIIGLVICVIIMVLCTIFVPAFRDFLTSLATFNFLSNSI